MSGKNAMYTSRILVRCQPVLLPAIKRAAAAQLMAPSEYIRRCVIDRLKADGIDPVPKVKK